MADWTLYINENIKGEPDWDAIGEIALGLLYRPWLWERFCQVRKKEGLRVPTDQSVIEPIIIDNVEKWHRASLVPRHPPTPIQKKLIEAAAPVVLFDEDREFEIRTFDLWDPLLIYARLFDLGQPGLSGLAAHWHFDKTLYLAIALPDGELLSTITVYTNDEKGPTFYIGHEKEEITGYNLDALKKWADVVEDRTRAMYGWERVNFLWEDDDDSPLERSNR